MLKIGVIGVGALGRHHARIYAELPDVELVAVADVNAARAKETAAAYGCAWFTGFEELLGRVDAVSIAAPTAQHAALGQRCLAAGLDVLVEKPIASSLEGARALIEAARAGERILQVGHVERFNPIVEAAARIATRPQFFEVHRLSVFSMRSLDVDVVLDLMIHDIDIALSLVQSEIREVRAAGIPILSAKADIANARLEFENGCVANFTASRVSTEKVRRLRFFQPHAYVSIDYAAQQGRLLSLEGGRLRQEALEPPAAEPLKAQLAAFVASIRDRATPRVSGDAGLRALEVALRVNREIEAHAARRADHENDQ